ncbi:MAG: hypothetical protein J2P22_02260 [Nocardioides sp.]|nr:hypothetical protein [Nocardioides sp.]
MKIISTGVVVGIATAALVALAPAAHADGGQTVMIRQGDLLSTLSDTRSAGHVEFLGDGLHVFTDDATSNAKAAEYFAVPTQPIPASASLTWYGTTPQPGSQIVFDEDSDRGNTNTWNVLVGEPAYGDDFWMSTGSDVYKNHHDLCPQTGGGFGSDCHGTLAEWQQAFPGAEVYAAGFSLGSGVKGDGVIHDIQVGSTDYQFTNVAPPPVVTKVAVSGSAEVTQIDRRAGSTLKMHFTTDALGADQVQGRRLRFKVTDNGEVVYRATMNADAEATVKFRFAKGSGRHKVQVLKNGVVDQRFVLKMGR